MTSDHPDIRFVAKGYDYMVVRDEPLSQDEISALEEMAHHGRNWLMCRVAKNEDGMAINNERIELARVEFRKAERKRRRLEKQQRKRFANGVPGATSDAE